MFVLHNKVGCHALYLCIGLRPYALGAGWQGGVAYELAHFIRRPPCLGTLLVTAPHSVQRSCAGLYSMNLIGFSV